MKDVGVIPSHAGIPFCLQLETCLYESNKKKIPHVMKNSARELQLLGTGLDFITVMKLHKLRLSPSLPAVQLLALSPSLWLPPHTASLLTLQLRWGRQGCR